MKKTVKELVFPIEGYGYYIKKLQNNFILYDEDGATSLLFGKRSLSTKGLAKDIQDITSAPLRVIRQTLAVIMEQLDQARKLGKVPKRKEPQSFSEDIIGKAEKVLELDPLQFIVDTAHLLHAGDTELLKIEYVSALSSKLSKTKINLWPIGGSGKGKTHSMTTVILLLPGDLYEIFTSASPLSLFYYVKHYGPSALDGILLFIDEVEAAKNALPMLRSLTGQTEITPRHLSVYDAELLDLKIKGQRPVWFTSVKTFGSDQIKNRFINLNPDETENQDNQVFGVQDRLFREEKCLDLEPFKIAQAMTSVIIKEMEEKKVIIPFQIKWAYKERRFLYPVFLAFIRVIAKIHFKHRRQDANGNLIASIEDFELTKDLWKALEKPIRYRVTKSALSILDELSNDKSDAQTHAELTEKLPLGTRQIERLCEELLNEGLVNRAKRDVTRGRPAWEYWKATLPSIEDIQAITGDMVVDEIHNELASSATLGTDVEKSKNMLLKFTPYQGDGPCEICGEKSIQWKATDVDGENPVYGCPGCARAYLESYR